jgi:hypothetical protein
MDILTKVCLRCHTAKSVDDFSTDNTRADGKYVYCWDCKRLAHALWYAKNSARRITQTTLWRAANADAVRAADRARKAARRKAALEAGGSRDST